MDSSLIPPHPPPPSVYFALMANDQVRRFINIHLHLQVACELPDTGRWEATASNQTMRLKQLLPLQAFFGLVLAHCREGVNEKITQLKIELSHKPLFTLMALCAGFPL